MVAMSFFRYLPVIGLIGVSLVGWTLQAQQTPPGQLQKEKVSFEEGLASINSALDSIQEEVKSAEGKYLSPLTLNREYVESAAKKLEKADFYFQKKDYVSAGSLYYSIINSRKEKDVIWEEAQFKLAETLFLNNNYISAARYYETLLKEKPYSRFQVEALKRLIASAYRLGEYAKAKTYYRDFIEIGYDISRDQELIYFLGKSLFFDAQYEDAARVFSAVQKENIYYPQSLYFRGVISLQNKEIDRALTFFREAADLTTGSYFKADQIRDLAVLATGRLLFEKGDLAGATDYYLRLDHSSSFFAEAYLELCWVYIRREQWEKALEALRLVKYIAPGSLAAPQAEILEGNILIKLRRYGEAMVLFNHIVKKYQSIRDQLKSLKTTQEMLSLPLDASLETDFSLYSPLVRSLLKGNKKFSHAMHLRDELKQIESEMEQIAKLESKLENIVANKNAAAIFPPLKQGSEIANSLQNRLVMLRNMLVNIHAREASKGISSQDRERFISLEEKKEPLEKQIRDLTSEAGLGLEERISRYAIAILVFEEEIHRAAIRAKAASDQIEAIRTYYLKNQPTPDDRILKKMDGEQQYVTALRETLMRLRQETEEEKNRLLLGGDLLARMIIARDTYSKILTEQENILSRSTALSPERKQRLLETKERLDALSGAVDQFGNKLNDVVGGILHTIKEAFENEKIRLEEYKSQLLSLKREVKEVAALAVTSNLSRLNKTFDDFILQADLGIIDVAWERKEEATQNLNRLRTRMAQEIRELYLNLENLE